MQAAPALPFSPFGDPITAVPPDTDTVAPNCVGGHVGLAAVSAAKDAGAPIDVAPAVTREMQASPVPSDRAHR
jgi:hypothetical protein